MARLCYMLFFILAMQGCFAFRCDETRVCDDTYSAIEELSDLGFTPNPEQLARLCPRTLRFFECYFEQLQKCMTFSIPELAATGHDFASEIIKAKNLIIEICNDDSTLHKEYIANNDCIRDVTRAQSPVCKGNNKKLVKEFLESRSVMDTIWASEEKNRDDQSCLETVYTIACLGEDIKRNCGLTARKVFLNVLEHSKIAIPSKCSKEDGLVLKLEFLKFLKLQDEMQDYWSVFYALRR